MLPLIACHSHHWNNSLFISCTITEFCMTPLALDNWRQKYCHIVTFISLFFWGGGGLSLRFFNWFIASNFFVPALLGIVFRFCNVFQIVKVGSSTLLTKLSFRHGFYLVRVVRVTDVHVAWLVYVRTYCVPIVTLNQNNRSGRHKYV